MVLKENITRLDIYPPFYGVVINLKEVPDPVFAEKMVGDGVACDPLDGKIYAPIDGVIKSVHRSQHAITIDSQYGFDLLLHLGLDTVNLKGQGFKIKVKAGEKIKRGDLLGEIDLNYLSNNALSLISPLLVTDIDEAKFKLDFVVHSLSLTNLNSPIMTISLSHETQEVIVNKAKNLTTYTESLVIKNKNGLHARPAAVISQLARKYVDYEILLYKNENSANLKSVVSILGLSVQYQDHVRLVVKGEEPLKVFNELKIAVNDLHDDESENPNATFVTLEETHQVQNGCYYGVSASSGMVLAKLNISQGVKFNYEQVAADLDSELANFKQAINNLSTKLNQEINSLGEFDIAHKNILNAHLMILTDPDLMDNVKQKINVGHSAAYAWELAIDNACDILLKTNNPLLIERRIDLLDLKSQILSLLCGEGQAKIEFMEEVILVAEDFTPSEVINLSPLVKGLVSVKGGITSHVAILARSRGIPLLVGVSREVLLEEPKEVLLDTISSAVLKTRVDEAEKLKIKEQIIGREKEQALALADSMHPATTIDNVQINCLANIANLADAKLAVTNGAEGVGLFRTEFMFLETSAAPSIEYQTDIYTKISQVLKDKPLVVRTLDVGGDKKIPYITQVAEENPMLGVRGIRLSLANPELFKTQLTAILKTNAPNLKIMLPMISKLSEVRQVKQMFNSLKDELNVNTKFELGIMVEVPSVALMSELFSSEVDFMSIGSNDLTQYIMAIDREHTSLASEVDHLHPSVIRAIKLVADGANKNACPVSVCGLMASEQIALPILIGLGITNFSMTINAIPSNKAFIRSLSVDDCRLSVEHCLTLKTALEVREFLKHKYLEV